MTVKGLPDAFIGATPTRTFIDHTDFGAGSVSPYPPIGISGNLQNLAIGESTTNVNVQTWVIEIPFMAATTLDDIIADPGDRAVQQNRKLIREALGLPEVKRYSLGTKGSFSLDPTAVLMAFVARSRWSNRDILESYHNVFRACGLSDVVRSDAYAACVSGTVERVRAECRGLSAEDFGPGIVNSVALEQLHVDRTAREVAKCFSRALDLLADTHVEVERVPGHVVRIDGPEAIIVIETPERHELHRIDAKYLERFGLRTAGSAFVLHRQKWTPDTTVGMYIPAIRNADRAEVLEAHLRAAEKPLPAF